MKCVRHPVLPSSLYGALFSLLVGCGGGENGTTPDTGMGGEGNAGGADSEDPDPDPVFTDEEMAALAELSPAELPPVLEDASNALADDAAAALFGQRMFFDPSISGELIDGDN